MSPMTQAGLPYQSFSETSYQAALAAEGRVDIDRARIYAYIAGRIDGATQREVSEALQIPRQTVAPRTLELQKAGKLVRTELRRGGCYVYRIGEAHV